MEIKCPQCGKRYAIRRPGKYKCKKCGGSLPDVRPGDLKEAQAEESETPPQEVKPATTSGPVGEVTEPLVPETTSRDEIAALEAGLPQEVRRKIETLESQIEKNPSAKAPYLQLAQLFLDSNARELAVKTYGRYLKVDPENAYVKNRVELLTGKARSRKSVDFTPQVNQAELERERQKVRNIILYGALGIALIIAAVLLKPVIFPSAKLIFAAEYSAQSPVWSPDGKKVAFLASKPDGSTLAVFDVKAGSVREICKTGEWYTGTGMAWSPLGQEIAFVSGVDGEEGLWGSAVYIVNVDSGEKKRVAMGSRPSWSPDGGSIALISRGSDSVYKSWESEAYETVCVANVLTGSIQRLSELPGDDASFSPSSSDVVYAVPLEVDWEEYEKKLQALRDEGGAEGADMTDFLESALSGGAATDIDARKGLAREAESMEHRASKGRGRGKAFAELMTHSNIHIASADGMGEKILTEDGRASSPVWSPDGEWILYSYVPKGEEEQVWKMRPDGSEKGPLLSASDLALDPKRISLTPDNRNVIYQSTVEEVNEAMAIILIDAPAIDLYCIAVDGTEPKRLKNKHPFKHDGVVSPDGKSIAYEIVNHESKASELWMMSL